MVEVAKLSAQALVPVWLPMAAAVAAVVMLQQKGGGDLLLAVLVPQPASRSTSPLFHRSCCYADCGLRACRRACRLPCLEPVVPALVSVAMS